MPVDKNEMFFCEKCKKTMRADEFYNSNNLEKYPTGKLTQCKKDITMHVDNWNPDTFLWILQETDVPYVAQEWNGLLQKYGQDKSKVSGMTILGRYLSKMRLKQYKDYRWKDTAFLQEMADHKVEEAMKRQGYGAAEIAVAIQDNGKIDIPQGELSQPQFSGSTSAPDYFADRANYSNIDLGMDLTEEDKKSLLLKWGKAYRPEEWVRLEQLYEEMTNSYDIQGAGHEDILKLVCKTSLKANQLLDIGDVDGAQKMVKMYDGLMKSGKFTAAQNKAEQGEYLNSISELVVICEQQGFIPRYYVDSPKDKVDETIMDMKDYTHTLVMEEMNLGNLIEGAIKQMRIEETKAEDEDIEDEDITLEELDALKEQDALTFEDYEDYEDFQDAESEKDAEIIKRLLNK